MLLKPIEALDHLAGDDDDLATAAPLRALLIPGFAAFLPHADPATTARTERAPTIVRPMGASERIAALERRLGRPLTRGKPGPKPQVDREPERRQRLL